MYVIPEFAGPAGDVEARIDDLGLRTATLDEQREEFLTRVGGTLSGLRFP